MQSGARHFRLSVETSPSDSGAAGRHGRERVTRGEWHRPTLPSRRSPLYPALEPMTVTKKTSQTDDNSLDEFDPTTMDLSSENSEVESESESFSDQDVADFPDDSASIEEEEFPGTNPNDTEDDDLAPFNGD